MTKGVMFLMIRVTGIFLAIVMALMIVGCGKSPEKIQEDEFAQSLTQTFEHNDYSVKLPQTWKVTKDSEPSNPTLYFEVKKKRAGGLFLARYDKLEELPANRKEVTELRSEKSQVFSYSTKYESEDGSSDATVVCFYVPAKNSGYEFVFVNNLVAEAQALAIAHTVRIK
jgi:hypothetical protein